ncbi:hypothetical protein BBJ28_00002865 [Nothophytophthora sp. Chile5]|nr:hypothetical protein BBJ28_00002865 [Nothophytophthora sp. Chile5]
MALLTEWAANGRLSYKFSVIAVSGGTDAFAPRVQATFSKPDPRAPSPAAVARLYFHLETDRQKVRGFTVEQDPHFHELDAVRFDEAVLDRVVRRKLQLQAARLVDVADEFASTRVPAVVRARAEEQRERDRETLEEYLLEQLQQGDAYNEGRLPLAVFRETLDALELDSRVAPREVLLALVAADRNDMVEYGELVAILAVVIDALSGGVDPRGVAADGKAKGIAGDEDEALDAFEEISACQTHYTVEKLTALLVAHAARAAAAFNAVTARQSIVAITAKHDSASGILEETKEGDESEEDEADAATAGSQSGGDDEVVDEADDREGASTKDSSRRASSHRELHVTRQQLRAILETPQLLLSRAEINLMLALVDTNTNVSGTLEIPCTQLGALLRRVRRLIFRFQRKGFVDRTEKYLLQQMQAFESSSLQGSARHLKQQLKQKEVKMVIKDLQKLLLSPYQTMQLVALSEERPGMPENVVNYQEVIPRMVCHLEELVDTNTMSEKAAMLHEMGVWDFSAVALPSEEVVRQASFDCFVGFDQTQLGVIPIADFHEGLKQLAETHDFPVGTLSEMKQLGALADPNGSGRVNYVFFQHLMYPVLLALLQERELAAMRDDARKRHNGNDISEEIEAK